MNAEVTLQLAHPPIVEAVVDIDCDLPVGVDFASLEAPARERFATEYPRFRRQMLQEHQIKKAAESPLEHNVRTEVQAFQFFKDDERQIVQVRSEGFSFNRMAPYSSLDEYVPEIERCWHLFVQMVEPSQIRRITLRYINRILLPTVDTLVDLDEYLALSPQLADENTLKFVGFVDQHSVVEKDTNHLANVILVMQDLDGEKLPLIFDIEAMHIGFVDPRDWATIQTTITSLRRLKNLIFRKTLTEKCLNLFQQ